MFEMGKTIFVFGVNAITFERNTDVENKNSAIKIYYIVHPAINTFMQYHRFKFSSRNG